MATKSDKQAGKDRRDAQRDPRQEGAIARPDLDGHVAFHAWDIDNAPISDHGPVAPRNAP
jgi:hypothetical protein